jgi:hypothetical protein
MRDGYYAQWRGAQFEASPDGELVRLYATGPTEGFVEAGHRRFLNVVPVKEIEQLVYVSTLCTWQGETFQVLGEHEEWVRVEYVGGHATVAEQLGLEAYDRGVYQAWAPRTELSDLREEVN